MLGSLGRATEMPSGEGKRFNNLNDIVRYCYGIEEAQSGYVILAMKTCFHEKE